MTDKHPKKDDTGKKKGEKKKDKEHITEEDFPSPPGYGHEGDEEAGVEPEEPWDRK